MRSKQLTNDELALVMGGVVSDPNPGSGVANKIGDSIGLRRDSSGNNLLGRIGGAVGQMWRAWRYPYILN
jgi:bacteriocin-like protein